MGGDDRPQGEVGDEHGVGVGHGEGLWALEGPHGHVGGDGRPQGEGGDGLGVGVGHEACFVLCREPSFCRGSRYYKKRMLVHRQLFYLAVHGKKMYTEI